MKLKHTKVATLAATLAATLITLGSLAGGANAAVTLTVTGGINSSLEITVSEASGFVASGNSSGDAFLLFENFWNNTASNLGTTTDTTALVASLGINGTTNPTHTGAVQVGGFDAADLIVGFVAPSLTSGQTVSINLGTRTTTNNLPLNYTTSGIVNGDVRIVNASGGALTNTVSYTGTITSIPEPSSLLLLGLGALGFATRRHRI